MTSPEPDPTGAAREQEPGLSFVSLLNVALRHARLLVGLPVVAVVVAVALLFLVGKDFVAESALKPQAAASTVSRLAGFAAQFGIGNLAAPEADSPEFYAALLRSTDLLRATVETEYRFAVGEERRDTMATTLVALYGGDADERPERRTRQAVLWLDDHVSATPDLTSGLLRLRTEAPWPELAVAINRRMIELLHAFNIEERQSQAKAEREFVETRMQEAGSDLRQAEEDLRTFLEQNRSIGASPELAFRQARLQRRVDMQQQIYSSLAQSYEQARIDEVRNTPVVTVVDHPDGSAHPAGPGLPVVVLAAAILGLIVAAALALVRESMDRDRRSAPAEYAEFQRLRRGAAATALRLFRRGSR